MAADTPASAPARHRPRSTTVFVAAFVAGAAAAVGVNRALDVHLAQAKPQVECEPIFVALRSLPQGTPVTVWDVALRDWPKAMLPATALRVTDSFEGYLLKFPLREGQPLLAAQLLKAEATAPAATEPATADGEETLVEEAFVPPAPAKQPVASPTTDMTAQPMSDQAGTVQPPVEPTVTPTAEPRAATATDAATTMPSDVPAVAVAVRDEERAVEIRSADLVSTDAAQDDPAEPTVSGQPTLAVPQDSERGSAADASAAATAAAPQSPNDSRLSSDIDADFGVPARPPVDLSSIPSVMSRVDDAAAPTDDETGPAENVRYLVVPERIARQADTSFTTPVAPEGRPVTDQPQVSTQPQVSGRPQAAAQPAQQRRTATSPSRQPQSRQAQSKSQAKPQQPRSQPQQKSDAPESEQPSPRAWGGMFPNVSAGLDAIGGWRGRVREAEVPKRPAGEPASPRR